MGTLTEAIEAQIKARILNGDWGVPVEDGRLHGSLEELADVTSIDVESCDLEDETVTVKVSGEGRVTYTDSDGDSQTLDSVDVVVTARVGIGSSGSVEVTGVVRAD